MPFNPKPPSLGTAIALQAWNMMGGEIDWVALPIVIELFGIENVPDFVDALITIRNWRAANTTEEA